MTEVFNGTETDTDFEEAKPMTERETLEERAKRLGIGFNAKTSTEILKLKIEEKLKKGNSNIDEDDEEVDEEEKDARTKAFQEATKLIRVIVTPTTAEERELQGEIFTVANSLVGTLRKFVPFGNEQGYHIPNIMYQMLKEKQIQIFRTKKVNGQEIVEGKLIPAYSIQVLPPLTKEELKKLEQSQRARQSVED